MKKVAFILFCLASSVYLFGQSNPDWIDSDLRNMKFPTNVYYTGFAYGEIPQGQTQQTLAAQMKIEAQADLSRKIYVRISTQSQNKISAISHNGQYDEQENFINQSSAESHVEVVGVKIESYYDPKTKFVYAFAYVNRHELTDYYENVLSLNLMQAESMIQTAQELESNTEKSKARKQCETARPLFEKIRQAQEMLTAITSVVSGENLQQTKTEQLYNTFIQMSARLAQAIYVYVESDEDLFGTSVDIVANKLKAALASNGCSFTDDLEQADFRLKIKVSTRTASNQDNMVFCYADTFVEFYDRRKQKTVYSDEIAQKGGSNSQDKAGRKAMSDVVPKIAEKLQTWTK